jgi:GTPase Era involved in 16S rRNA processing
MKSALLETQKRIDAIRDFVDQSPWRNDYIVKLDSLRTKIDEPCVLAVAGRVKAGKSSFLNALLGKDLAKVGITETTATINIFKYGKPEDPEKPVKVVWENGISTYESLNFMDSLQGNDAATLKRAEGIKWLEYILEDEILKDVTLVDTPGTDAIVGEDGDAHQAVTEEFFNLRKKHRQETEEQTNNADAVIYLIGHVANKTGQSFLQDFKESSNGNSSSINAIGVISKIDVSEKVVEEREMHAANMSQDLREELNTVVPVSAGLWIELCRLKKENKLGKMQQGLKTIPPKAFEFMMKQESLFRANDTMLAPFYKETTLHPLSLEHRTELIDNMHWSIFRLIAKHLYNYSLEDAETKLIEIAGMDKVKQILKEHFFKRSRLIRCYGIISQLSSMLTEIRRNKIYQLRMDSSQLKNYEQFITSHSTAHEQDLANSLLSFIRQNLKTGREIDALESRLVEGIIPQLEHLHLELQKTDEHFNALQLIQKHKEEFDPEEIVELSNLFGLYENIGCSKEQARIRQQYWNEMAFYARNKNRKLVAEYAVKTYGNI